jgi:ATP-dependent Clp protease adaptor protein ClpS
MTCVMLGYEYGVATETPTRNPQRARPGDGTSSDRPWQVVVLNDNHNTFEGVAAALAETLPGVGYEQGLRYADWIHRRGRAVVWSGNRERAELYHQQLVGHGLTMAPIQQA